MRDFVGGRIEETVYTVHSNDIMILFKADVPINDDLLGSCLAILKIHIK